MQLKTILNRVTNYKSFVVEKVNFTENTEQLALEVAMRHRANGRPICSGCGIVRPGYGQALAETSREPDEKTGGETQGDSSVQSEVRTQPSDEGGLPAILGV